MEAVMAYLGGKGSQLEICKEYKIRSTIQLLNWIKVYNAHGDFNSRKGSGGGSYMKQGRSTTQEERIQIAKECLESGKNYGEMALKYNVSYQQARTWTLRFEEFGEAGLEDRRGKRKKDQTPRTELERLQIENEQLKHKLYLAEMERDLLKKLEEIERRDASQE
jgi:transposase-like protein